MSEGNVETTPARPPSLVRWLYALGGIVCVGLGALGAMLPGLPTTVFLIIASFLFARSCPTLERVLIRNRLFAPFLGYVDGTQPIPRRSRIIALCAMWISVTISVMILARGDHAPDWVLVTIVAAACIGMYFILRIGRNRSRTPIEQEAI